MFHLPKLLYSTSSLEPFLSSETFDYHYGKHHKMYVDNTNLMIRGTQLKNSSLEEIILLSDGSLCANASQAWNHAFFWHCMRPELDRSEHPRLPVKLEQAIHSSFQSLKNFQDLFTDAVMKLFGSGWVWLVMDSSHKLKIFSLPNAESPLKSGLIPILTCDVWEHSYYIDYRNNRRKYVESFMKVINWSFALQNFERAQIPDMTQTMRFNFKAEETKVETTKPLFMKEV